MRLLDGVDPHIIDEIEETARGVEGVSTVSEIKARWIGHALHAQFSIGVKSELSVGDGEKIAGEVNHQLYHKVTHLSDTAIDVISLKQE